MQLRRFSHLDPSVNIPMLRILTACIALASVCSASPVREPLVQRPLDGYNSQDSQHGCTYGCDDVPVADETLRTYIKDLMERGHVPGLAIAILDGNKTWAEGFGHAIIDHDIPVTPSTLFYCGSTTKSFTAAAISLLIDDFRNSSSIDIVWDSPVVRFLREDWMLSDAWATEHVTLEDALSHHTGYPRHDFARTPTNARDLVRNLRNLPMSAEPRVKFQYCNMMFGVMGYLVSKLTGSWLGDFFHERLWEPMGMKTTYLTLSNATSSGLRLADEYWYNNDTNSYETLPHQSFAWEEGAGMVISNVLDYSRYMRVMMNKTLPISSAGHAALKTARSIAETNMAPFTGPVYYGLGWYGGVFAGEEVWFHAGQIDGHISKLMMVPSRQFAVVTMLNAASWAQEVLSFKVLYDYLGVRQEERFDIEMA
jgi:CubicO group peptidase (beta-lactamase class C family)